jgi:hypothetical protein
LVIAPEEEEEEEEEEGEVYSAKSLRTASICRSTIDPYQRQR